MPDEPERCWGCGDLILFRTIGTGYQQRIVAVDYEEFLEGRFVVHECEQDNSPPKFLPAMGDYTIRVECPYGCNKTVYQLPVRGGMGGILFLERLIWSKHGWTVHPCGILRTWYIVLDSLSEGCAQIDLPKPKRLATVVCVKPITGPYPESDQEYSIALKTVSGGCFCPRFVANGDPVEIVHGDLAVLCGRGPDRKLLVHTNGSTRILPWVGDDEPGTVGLRWDWCSRPAWPRRRKQATD